MTQRASILLVDGNRADAEMLTAVLTAAGYQVQHAASGAEAKALLQHERPALIILDLLLPDVDGLVLCASLRNMADTPIIICSESRRRWDAVLSMKLGADDFIAKPFDPYELEARVEAALRRSGSSSPDASPGEVAVGMLALNQQARRVTLGGRSLQLTSAEYRLLLELVSRPNEVVSRDELAQALWSRPEHGSGRAIDTHMARLRRKLSAGPVPGPLIVAERGFGYKIVVPPGSPSARTTPPGVTANTAAAHGTPGSPELQGARR